MFIRGFFFFLKIQKCSENSLSKYGYFLHIFPWKKPLGKTFQQNFIYFWVVVVVWNFSPQQKKFFKNKIIIWDFQCKFLENPQISNIWVAVFVWWNLSSFTRFILILIREQWAPLRAHHNMQHQHKNQKSKVSRLIWGYSSTPSFQIFHGTHHKLHSLFLKQKKDAKLLLTKSKTLPPPPPPPPPHLLDAKWEFSPVIPGGYVTPK